MAQKYNTAAPVNWWILNNQLNNNTLLGCVLQQTITVHKNVPSLVFLYRLGNLSRENSQFLGSGKTTLCISGYILP